MKRELLLGCGNSREKQVKWTGSDGPFENVTTLDIDQGCEPDVVHDLNVMPLPFDDDSFDEIHAYECLEHTGKQGDWKFFFDQFSELHRLLKPGGLAGRYRPDVGLAVGMGRSRPYAGHHPREPAVPRPERVHADRDDLPDDGLPSLVQG